MKIPLSIVDMIFGCWHRHLSFPFTTNKSGKARPPAAFPTGTYVVCLDCGKEFSYDWQQMKIVEPAKALAPSHRPVEVRH